MKNWNGKPYHSLDYMLRETFGEKVYKVTLNGGMSCPNRDGKLGSRGCIFCSEGGSGDFAADAALTITEQIDSQIAVLSAKRPIHKYIAYFQAYTNTYAPVEYLRKIFTEAIHHPSVVALSIGTRPDCLGEDVLDLLQTTAQISAQTMHPIITMSMGKLGVISRISGATFGSAVTFATVGQASAPGQIPLDKMRAILQAIN